MEDEPRERLLAQPKYPKITEHTIRNRAQYSRSVEEGRKRVLLIAASILAARNLGQWDGRPSPAIENTIANAIALATRILQRIDNRWPTPETGPHHR